MPTRTELDINEDSYAPITLYLTEDGTVANPILSASVNSIEMTLINVTDGEIVNTRQKQDVFDANNCTLHATSGLFTWDLQPEDVEIVSTTPIGKIERHLATITVVWDTTKKMHFEIELHILNLRSVPQVSA